jgi:mRNA-degrading endonuclease RelE of RelBE toxin-antitoxin system
MTDERIPIRVIKGGRFRKDIKNLRKRYRSIEDDIQPLIEQLKTGETLGDRIAGNDYTVYKVRVKNSDVNRGQSGGYRVIYYIRTATTILLVKIYSKSDRDDIGNEEVEDAIGEFEAEIERRQSVIDEPIELGTTKTFTNFEDLKSYLLSDDE